MDKKGVNNKETAIKAGVYLFSMLVIILFFAFLIGQKVGFLGKAITNDNIGLMRGISIEEYSTDANNDINSGQETSIVATQKTKAPICGNGFIDINEQCDCGENFDCSDKNGDEFGTYSDGIDQCKEVYSKYSSGDLTCDPTGCIIIFNDCKTEKSQNAPQNLQITGFLTGESDTPEITGMPGPIMANHSAASAFETIPQYWINKAKTTLRIGYAHTSHGQQPITGIIDLNPTTPLDVSFTYQNQDTGSYSPSNAALCIGNTKINDSTIFLHNYKHCLSDLGAYPAWIGYTTDPLLRTSRNRSILMWSWGCELSTTCADGSDYITSIQELYDHYLTPFQNFETNNPDVTFIYMTGQLDGKNSTGQLHRFNEYIREYARNNSKILYDFADIERYDPGGVDYLNLGAGYNINGDGVACLYDGGTMDWCVDWCTAHPSDCTNLNTGCDHSNGVSPYYDRLNCRLKGKAFWWLTAKLAGWDGTPACNATNLCPTGYNCSLGICNATGISVPNLTEFGLYPTLSSTSAILYSANKMLELNVTKSITTEMWHLREPIPGSYSWEGLDSKMNDFAQLADSDIFLRISPYGYDSNGEINWYCNHSIANEESCVFLPEYEDDFQRYINNITQRYSGNLYKIQFANEWNNENHFIGSAQDYVKYANWLFDISKNNSPDTIVSLGGITKTPLSYKARCLLNSSDSYFIEEIYLSNGTLIPEESEYLWCNIVNESGTYQKFEYVMANVRYDEVDVHLYDDPQYWDEYVGILQTYSDKPIIVSEFGGPAPENEYNDPGNETYQAYELRRYINTLIEIGIPEAYFFQLIEKESVYHNNSGLIKIGSDGNPIEKSTFEVFKNRYNISYQWMPGICGNYICETGEGFNNCLTDCGPFIVDHNAVDKFNQIPDYYINKIKNDRFTIQFPGQSHGQQIYGIDGDPNCYGGLRLLAQQDPKYAVQIQCSLNSFTSTNTLRLLKGFWNPSTSTWAGGDSYQCRSGEENYWANAAARTLIQNSPARAIAQGTNINASGFGWCWDIIRPTYCNDENNSLITYNDERNNTYLNAINNFGIANPRTNFFYTTGPTDNEYTGNTNYLTSDGWRITKYNSEIRTAAITNKGILFDGADIENWNNANTAQRTNIWNDAGTIRTLYLINSDYTTGVACSHANNLLHIRKAKAMWYLAARLEGWDGISASTCTDADGDGYGSPADATCAYPELDCNNSNASINPGAIEICNNNVDEDCNGLDSSCVSCQLNLSISYTGCSCNGANFYSGYCCLINGWQATSCPALTTPSITSMNSTTLNDGKIYLINGLNFGTMNPNSDIQLWENFDDGADGTTISGSPDLGTWTLNSPAPFYCASNARKGLSSYYNSTNGAYHSQFMTNMLHNKTRFYISFWYRFYHPTDFTQQIKLFQLWGSQPFSTDYDPGIMSGGASSTWWTSYYATDMGFPANIGLIRGNWPSVPSKDQWHHFEAILQQSDDNITNGSVILKNDNIVVYQNISVVTRTNRNKTQELTPQYWDQMIFFYGFTNGVAGQFVEGYVDDAYLSSTWVRIELGNASSYNASNLREIQIPLSWSTNIVVFKANTGNLTFGTAYLYLTDSNGIMNVNGFPVNITNQSSSASCMDGDSDGYGNPSSTACTHSELDCDDANANIHPEATETCNGLDDDCDELIDENLGTTTCGFGVCNHTIQNCIDEITQMCNPLDGMQYEDEITNCEDNIDNDCNGYDIPCGYSISMQPDNGISGSSLANFTCDILDPSGIQSMTLLTDESGSLNQTQTIEYTPHHYYFFEAEKFAFSTQYWRVCTGQYINLALPTDNYCESNMVNSVYNASGYAHAHSAEGTTGRLDMSLNRYLEPGTYIIWGRSYHSSNSQARIWSVGIDDYQSNPFGNLSSVRFDWQRDTQNVDISQNGNSSIKIIDRYIDEYWTYPDVVLITGDLSFNPSTNCGQIVQNLPRAYPKKYTLSQCGIPQINREGSFSQLLTQQEVIWACQYVNGVGETITSDAYTYLNGAGCSDGQTISCGSGVCQGERTCNVEEWSSCSTFGLDVGICSSCDINGEISFNSTQNTDCTQTSCPSDGCNAGNCGIHIFGDFPDSIQNSCVGINQCSNDACTVSCQTDSDSDTYSSSCGDCNDSNSAIHQGATDICENDVDEDCSGSDSTCFCGDGSCNGIETCSTCQPDCGTCPPLNCDADNDGYNSSNITCNGNDCVDINATIHPGAIEACSNGIDEDCNSANDICAVCSQGLISQRCLCAGFPHETGYCCESVYGITPCSSVGISISGITPSNSISHGSNYTISGYGFGIKNQVEPLRWDNFQDGANGSMMRDRQEIGGSIWDLQGDDYRRPNYSNTIRRYAGDMSVLQSFPGNQDPPAANKMIGVVNGPPSSAWYISLWIYQYEWDPSRPVSNTDNNKWFLFSRSGVATSPIIGWTEATHDNAGMIYSQPDDFTITFQKGVNAYIGAINSWSRLEVVLFTGYAPGASDGYMEVYANGELLKNYSGVIVDSSIGTTQFATMIAGEYWRTGNLGPDGIPNTGDEEEAANDQYLSEFYVDHSFARVEIGNAPTLAASTHREIQIPNTIWNNTQIQFTANKGSFANGEQLYLFVVNGSRNVSVGYPIILSNEFSGCIDYDSDGYGNPANSSCDYPTLDCNNTNNRVYPGAIEICNDEIDQDCNSLDSACSACANNVSISSRCLCVGTAYETGYCCDTYWQSTVCLDPAPTCTDSDLDGFGNPASVVCKYPQIDCNDINFLINPNATEVCGNGVDEDCNPVTVDVCHICTVNWICTGWSGDNCGTRTCTDQNNCGDLTNKPSESEICDSGSSGGGSSLLSPTQKGGGSAILSPTMKGGSFIPPVPRNTTPCNDSIDNENSTTNGCIDSADYSCGGKETSCSNQKDDDCDLKIDCNDIDCANNKVCIPQKQNTTIEQNQPIGMPTQTTPQTQQEQNQNQQQQEQSQVNRTNFIYNQLLWLLTIPFIAILIVLQVYRSKKTQQHKEQENRLKIQQLDDYLQKNINKNVDMSEIKAKLTNIGWTQEIVEQEIKKIQQDNNKTTSTTETKTIDEPN